MLSKYIIATGLLVSTTLAWGGEAGRVVFVTGQVQVGKQAAKLEAAVNEGDEIRTGADGAIYIKTVDAGFLVLRPNSTARIVTYKVDAANPANTKVKLELTQGVARAISGQGVKLARQNFRFNTPVAAIGVRGTDFVVYTDQQTSRVVVHSGGVVMAPFAGACTAEGVGPCEGSASRELFAGQAGMLLQVQRGQAAPQLLNNPSLSPDQTEKPRPDEPAGKVTTASTVTTGTVNLDPQKIEQALSNVRPAVDPTPTPTPDPTPKPPVVVPPIVVVDPPVPKPQEVFWGRWQTVAGQAVMPEAIRQNTTDVVAFEGQYAVARLKGATLVMPKEGTVAFSLVNSEASMLRANGEEMSANVESGKLAINFVNRTFDTGLVVTADQRSYDVNGKGTIDLRGQMESSSASATRIKGFISGPNVEEAGYVFRNSQTPGVTLIGATTWKKN
ncbi:hypothetical protein GTP41_09705 [Pseudoduganella sp. DS3]|uniref:FecR protein domain-containing protein n=1 Tax=Pseudoduganella guangdongensis TaxID=2692179 RepID=A0A6N9HFP5_9BURK|nr:FecR family protein [Pseudoduganella guangdongensis]MYN02374.1 hypothetical protein [Pseudoduganella guangdongensis]